MKPDEPQPEAGEPQVVGHCASTDGPPQPEWMPYLSGLMAIALVVVSIFAATAELLASAAAAFAMALGGAVMQIVLSVCRQPVEEDPEQRWRLRRGPFTMGIVLTVFLGLIAISMLFPASGRPKERVQRIKCASNLRQIGQAIAVYRDDHRVWPQTLAEVLMGGELNAEVFACPSSDAEKAPGLSLLEAALTLTNPKHCSYIYFPPPADVADVPAERVLAVERMENHKGKGMNILFGDGHVEWFDAKAAQIILDELKAGRNPPRTPAGSTGVR